MRQWFEGWLSKIELKNRLLTGLFLRRFIVQLTVTASCVMTLLFSVTASQGQGNVEKPVPEDQGIIMKIKLASIFVNDQEEALTFYTEVLGFVKKTDIPLGEFKWLTVVSSGDPDGTELLLEPNNNPVAKTYQQALFEQGIPVTTFFVEDIQETYEGLKKLGVKFTMVPTETGTTTVAVFDDTCGNLIMIAQE